MPKKILPHCVLSKITVSNNFMEIHMGGGVFKLGNPEGRGAEAVLEIQGDGGGSKTVPSVVGVWIFSGITHYTIFLKSGANILGKKQNIE